MARAAGLVAFGALTLSVWLGLGMSTRLLGPKRHKSLFGWHQTLAWTGLSMLALHAGALLFDPTLHFGLTSVLAPFASAWRPVAVAAGVVAGWLTLVLALSFRLRNRKETASTSVSQPETTPAATATGRQALANGASTDARP